MTRLLVVGAGLAGWFAALAAARRGARVTLVSEGRGGLALSHGCVDVWAADAPVRALAQASPEHPYAYLGLNALRSALDLFAEVTCEQALPYQGSLEANQRLPTAAGSVHATTFAPVAQAQGDLDAATSLTLAGLAGFRDFYPALAAGGLRRAGFRIGATIDLPLSDAPTRRDAYATDLARLFDDAGWREETARAWKPRIGGAARVALPAVLGMHAHTQALEDLQARLGVVLAEIPTLPPSVPGLRLEAALRRACLEARVDIIEGPHAVGRVDGRTGGRVLGVVTQAAGGARAIEADVVLLATGGLLHGGLVAQPSGTIRESVFDLPVQHVHDRAAWTAAAPLLPQPYEPFGLTVDERMRPLDADGRPVFENLFAAGGILAGARRAEEGSRQGIDLASAYRAVEAALA